MSKPRLTFRNVTDQRGAMVLAYQLAMEALRDPVGGPLVRETAIRMVDSCDARDDMCELHAVFSAVRDGNKAVPGFERGVKYMTDPELWSSDSNGEVMDHFTRPDRLIEQCQRGICAEDCLPLDTLLLRADGQLVPINNIEIGDLIAGDGGKWTRVTNKWDKGILPLLSFKLSNGSTLRCTAEHKVFRIAMDHDRPRDRNSAEEVRAGDLRPGDQLLTPETLPHGSESIDQERAWFLGVFIADGWTFPGGSRLGIAGKDGHPKEAQKRRVQAFAETLGLSTYWNARYININDRALTHWVSACGHLAPNKRVPHLNFNEETVRNILTGIAADAGDRRDQGKEFVYGTTSPTLALQLRIMHRMLGHATSIRRVDDHGGLGSHPIYRITPREAYRADGLRNKPFAIVKSIADDGEEPVCDIETDSGRFYLPESDLIVHNCDGMGASLMCALLGAIGFQNGTRIFKPCDSKSFEHIYTIVGFPKLNPTRIIPIDTTVDYAMGWEATGGEHLSACVSPEMKKLIAAEHS